MNSVFRLGGATAVLGAAAFGLHPTLAAAHGFAGARFFPATITNDDPFVADELSLPTVDTFKNGDRPATTQSDVSTEWSKRILENLGISLGETWTHLEPRNEPNKSGFQNLETTLKYQFLTSAEHEAIVSAGLSVEWGDTGARQVDAESFTTLTPTLYFGKGAGDLPDELGWLRPLALTGLIGYALPTDAGHTTRTFNQDTGETERNVDRHAQTLTYGVSLEYSLPYLQANVRDLGLPDIFNKLIPLVEFAAETPVQNRGGADTTAFINPGVIWAGQSFQVGAEAIFPINRATGRGVGAIGQLHFFLDDLFPTTIGRPIF
jgi:hypothetical protein